MSAPRRDFPLSSRDPGLINCPRSSRGDLRAFLTGGSQQPQQDASSSSVQQPETTERQEGEGDDGRDEHETADDNDSVTSVDFAGGPSSRSRGTRRKASRRSYVEQRDAADDDEFEANLIDQSIRADRDKERAELEKLATKSNGEPLFFSLSDIVAKSCAKSSFPRKCVHGELTRLFFAGTSIR